jgi:hypothetical protein
MTGFCEQDNDTSYFIKDGEITDYRSIVLASQAGLSYMQLVQLVR